MTEDGLNRRPFLDENEVKYSLDNDVVRTSSVSVRCSLTMRAPSKDRIDMLIERLPLCDEWLDDKYDWSL